MTLQPHWTEEVKPEALRTANILNENLEAAIDLERHTEHLQRIDEGIISLVAYKKLDSTVSS